MLCLCCATGQPDTLNGLQSDRRRLWLWFPTCPVRLGSPLTTSCCKHAEAPKHFMASSKHLICAYKKYKKIRWKSLQNVLEWIWRCLLCYARRKALAVAQVCLAHQVRWKAPVESVLQTRCDDNCSSDRCLLVATLRSCAREVDFARCSAGCQCASVLLFLVCVFVSLSLLR